MSDVPLLHRILPAFAVRKEYAERHKLSGDVLALLYEAETRPSTSRNLDREQWDEMEVLLKETKDTDLLHTLKDIAGPLSMRFRRSSNNDGSRDFNAIAHIVVNDQREELEFLHEHCGLIEYYNEATSTILWAFGLPKPKNAEYSDVLEPHLRARKLYGAIEFNTYGDDWDILGGMPDYEDTGSFVNMVHEHPEHVESLLELVKIIIEEREQEASVAERKALLGELPQFLVTTLNEHPDSSEEIMAFIKERGVQNFTPEAFREKTSTHDAVNEGWL